VIVEQINQVLASIAGHAAQRRELAELVNELSALARTKRKRPTSGR
jgi:hypothetical protein